MFAWVVLEKNSLTISITSRANPPAPYKLKTIFEWVFKSFLISAVAKLYFILALTSNKLIVLKFLCAVEKVKPSVEAVEKGMFGEGH